MYPFYIPSIYRHDSEFLIKIRDASTNTPTPIKYYIIIARHQYENYAKNFPADKLVVLPDTVIKISEIRQYILALARQNKETKIWMSDDDLSKFFIKKPTNSKSKEYQLKSISNDTESISSGSSGSSDYKLVEISFIDYITSAEKIFDKISFLDTKIVQFGFKYSTFAIPAKPITLNTNIGMIQLLDIEKLDVNINYDTSFTTLEDTDFTVQLLKNKLKSCQLNHYIFTAPKSGSGKGGLENEYLSGGKQKGMYQFLNKYPNLMEINDITNGKYKIKWNVFKDIEKEKQILDGYCH
jgi:predicted house-cleaning NTP pyrophosphatase (Maf/HAM1 superfamily)